MEDMRVEKKKIKKKMLRPKPMSTAPTNQCQDPHPNWWVSFALIEKKHNDFQCSVPILCAS